MKKIYTNLTKVFYTILMIVFVFTFSTISKEVKGQTVITISTTGSWTVPIGVTSITVSVYGAGGGSGGAKGATNDNASGGGGGGACAISNLTVSAGQVYTVTIGNGGTAGANTGTNGGTGGTSSFVGTGGTVSANGGGGGGGVAVTTGAAGTAGLGATIGVGTTIRFGGNGTTGFRTTTNEVGGAGGGGAGNAGNGGNGSGATGINSTGGASGLGSPTGAPFAGALGQGATLTAGSLAGVAGVAPGGGAAGCATYTTAAVGAIGGKGQVVITYTIATPPCSGTPNSGTATITSSTGCASTNFTLNTSGLSTGTGISYLWESSPNNSTWSSTGITTASYTSSTATTMYYRLKTTCSGSGLSNYTNVVSYTVVACTNVPSTGSNSVACGTNTMLYDNGGSAGNYIASSNGYTVFNNTSGSTGVISISGTYGYVETNYDYIRIYSGAGTGGTLLYTYSNTAGGTITPFSSAAGETITVQFTSDGSGQGAGFAILATYSGSCSPPPAAYQASFTAMNTGSSTWCAGEVRNVTVTVTNTGTATWTDAGPDINIGCKWNAESDYFVRADANNLAPGASATYTFAMTAPLTAGSENLSFNVVYEGCFWFSANPGSICGTTCSGNSVYTSGTQTISACEKIVPSSGSNSYTLCSGNLYDYGGSAGNYSVSTDGYTVLYPSVGGNVIQIAGLSSAGESCCDYVQVYNGVGTGGTLLGTYNMGTVVPTLTSSDASGALTIRFYSDVSVVGAGFNIAVSCVAPCVTPGTPVSLSGSATGSSTANIGWAAGSPAGSATVSYYWTVYTAGGVVVTSGNTTSTSAAISGLTCSTTYYFTVYSKTSCNNTQSSAATSGNFTTSAMPSPTAVTANPAAITCSGSANLNATSSGNTINWYTASTGGTSIGSSASGVDFSVSPANTTTYYAEANSPIVYSNILGNAVHNNTFSGSYTLGYSFTPSSNLTVSAVRSYFGSKVTIWDNTGVLITSQAVSGASATWTQTALASPIILTAGVTYRIGIFTNGGNYYWNSTPASSIFTNGVMNAAYESSGDVFPTGTSTPQWWLVDIVYSVGTGCVSSRVPVSVTVNPFSAPSSATASSSAICPGGTSQISAISTGNTINWYTTSTGGTSIGSSASGANYAVSPGGTTTYYAEAQSISAGTQTFNYTGSIVNWTVPAGITSVNITAKGASGGYVSGSTAGNGSTMSGTFATVPGQIFSILVGQSPGLTTLYPAGGGGTYVGLGSSNTTATPLIVAGGGGAGYGGYTGLSAGITVDATGTSPGTGGNGAPAGGCTGGGGGFYSSGGTDTYYGFTGGAGFQQGGTGGQASVTYIASYQVGGFGGGAPADYVGSCNQFAGNGGGYNGGSAFSTSTGYIGNAGGSYNGGTSQSNTAGNNVGNGQVIITWSGAGGCVSATRTPVTVTINPLPVVTTQPAATAICENAAGQFTVATSTSGSTYQWQYSGNNSIWTNTNGNAGVTGDNSATLYLDAPPVSWNGLYMHCIITSAAGCSITSNSAVMTINPLPVVNAGLDQTICPGNSAFINASQSVAGTVSWTSSPAGFTSSIINPSVYPNVTTTYTLTSILNGCSGADQVVVNVNNPSISAPTPLTTGDYVWHGSQTNDWTAINDWLVYDGNNYVIPAALPNANSNVFIRAANASCGAANPCTTPTLTIDICKNLTIEAGQTLTLGAGSTLNVSGNWTNYGTLISTTGIVNFNGTQAQTILSGGSNFYDAIFNNTTSGNSDIILSDLMTISNTGTFNNGIVNFINSGGLTFTEGATCPNGGSATSFVNTSGSNYVSKIGTNGFIFPVGEISIAGLPIWAPIEMTAPAASSTITADYNFSASPHNLDPAFMCDANIITHTSGIEHWMMTTTLSTPDLTLYWKDGNRSGINSLTDLKVAHFEDCSGTDKWVSKGGNISGTLTNGYITSTIPFTNYSPVTFGSLTTPLPISLSKFTANCFEKGVDVNWTTASETNNNYFTIERSTDANSWEIIETINGAGNSNHPINYLFTDRNSVNGKSYYRLKQTDFDGKFTYSTAAAVDCGSESSAEIIAYPNPAEHNVYFHILLPKKENVVLNIYDVIGQKIYSAEINVDGVVNYQVNLEEFATGNYKYLVIGKTQIFNGQFVKVGVNK
ncbi:MAG: hypothetical protein HXX09_01225 [Bacteroidetes bacterium]|nr:hypothetical protein [Bacteroidota bacterium]